jgi:hypothetical protein
MEHLVDVGLGQDTDQPSTDPEPAEDEVLLVFIINGQDVPVRMDPDAMVETVKAKALTDSGNTGRPPEDWELRDINGVRIEKVKDGYTLGEMNWVEGTRLFLSLKVGAGGS